MAEQTARMRTIKSAIQEIKLMDPRTEFKEWTLRQLVRTGRIRSVKVGSKYLIEMSELQNFLVNPPVEEAKVIEIGKLRRVAE